MCSPTLRLDSAARRDRDPAVAIAGRGQGRGHHPRRRPARCRRGLCRLGLRSRDAERHPTGCRGRAARRGERRISAGLSSGERIVALGAHLLKPGQEVRVAPETCGERQAMIGFNLSALAVRERAITLFLIIAVIGAGLFAFMKLGRAEDPSFTVKTLAVTAAWPGATAEEVQRQVADPIEKKLQELTYYDRIETTARPGLVLMKLNLKDSTPAAAVANQFYQTRKKLADLAPFLPKGVLGPFVKRRVRRRLFRALRASGTRPAAPAARRRGRNPATAPAAASRRREGQPARRAAAEDLRGDRARAAGHARHSRPGLVRGDRRPERPGTGRLRRDLRSPCLSASRRRAGSLDSVKAIPIAAGGRSLKLGDIAEVGRGYEDPPSFTIRNAGEPPCCSGSS